MKSTRRVCSIHPHNLKVVVQIQPPQSTSKPLKNKVFSGAYASLISAQKILRGSVVEARRKAGIDFLRETAPRARNIITNPPYGKGLADAFIDHAQKLTATTGGKVAMLLNLNSLCHPMRTERWRRKPPARLFGLDECVCWDDSRFGPVPWRKNKQRHVWAIWEPGHKGPAAFWWVSAREVGRDVHDPLNIMRWLSISRLVAENIRTSGLSPESASSAI